MTQNQFPPGWDDERVKRLLNHYEEQSEVDAVAEDEAAYADATHTFMQVPIALVPQVQSIIDAQTPH
jgi:hypothetical protein